MIEDDDSIPFDGPEYQLKKLEVQAKQLRTKQLSRYEMTASFYRELIGLIDEGKYSKLRSILVEMYAFYTENMME